MTEPHLSDLLDLATNVARAGARVALSHFGCDIAAEQKADHSPVTVADRSAEAMMRRLILEHHPDHSILGEEEGEERRDSVYRWLIDPIDGTRSFVRGVPLFGTLVGVEVKGVVEVGVIYMPVLKEMVSAARGLGCWANGRRARVSDIDSLGRALVVTTDERAARARTDGWDALVEATEMQRTWADCYAYVLVATGRAEVAVDTGMAPWDCGALLPIIEEAGGRFTSWTGERTVTASDVIASNGPLHDEARELLLGGAAWGS